jgi:hypothetical protein
MVELEKSAEAFPTVNPTFRFRRAHLRKQQTVAEGLMVPLLVIMSEIFAACSS